MTGHDVKVARQLRDRQLQRDLMQFFKPENDFEVREALLEAGRGDLIDSGCDALIPPQPPKEAIEARRRQANRAAADEDHYHTVANPARGEPGGRARSRAGQADRIPARAEVAEAAIREKIKS
jgi:hypothetical protein